MSCCWLFVLEETICHQKARFPFLDQLINVSVALGWSCFPLSVPKHCVWEGMIRKGKSGNLVLVQSVTWGICRAADICQWKPSVMAFYFSCPSAEEGTQFCDHSLVPSIAAWTWCFFLYLVVIYKNLFYLGLDHRLLMEHKKHKDRLNRFFLCKFWYCFTRDINKLDILRW